MRKLNMTEFIILIATQILLGVGIVYYEFVKQTDSIFCIYQQLYG